MRRREDEGGGPSSSFQLCIYLAAAAAAAAAHTDYPINQPRRGHMPYIQRFLPSDRYIGARRAGFSVQCTQYRVYNTVAAAPAADR